MTMTRTHYSCLIKLEELRPGTLFSLLSFTIEKNVFETILKVAFISRSIRVRRNAPFAHSSLIERPSHYVFKFFSV